MKFTSIILKAEFLLIFTLVISILLRFWLCLKGGQYFFVDEARFVNGHYLLAHFSDGDWHSILKRISTSFAHTLFIFLAAFAEGIRYLYVLCFVNSNASAHLLTQTSVAIESAAFILSFASTANILLLYLITRQLGGSKLQALTASILLFISTTNFYFSRHLLPYDSSISLALIGMYFGSRGNLSLVNNMICGFFGGLATLTYNGYWILSALIWTILILRTPNDWKKRANVAISCALAGISPLLLLHAASAFCGENFLSGMLEWLDGTMDNQNGDFGIGWKVFFSYLWSTERLIFWLYLGGSIIAFKHLRGIPHVPLNHASTGPYCVIFIMGLFFLFSDLVQSSVLYGRTIKQIVPFLCLACSYPLSRILSQTKSNRNLFIALVPCSVILICQFFYNYKQCFDLVFPSQFKNEAFSNFGTASELSSLVGPNIKKLESNYSDVNYTLINCQVLVPPIEGYKPTPEGKVLMSAKHPYTFEPYQYVHYNLSNRTLLKKEVLTMKLVRKLK